MNLHAVPVLGWIGLLALLPSTPAAPAPATDADALQPVTIHQREPIHFPARALSEGVVRGLAILLLDVDHTGRLVDLIALSYSRPEFANAALVAVRTWRFTPGRIGGEPVGSTITLSVQFEVSGVLAYVKPIGSTDESKVWGEEWVECILGVSALDRVPVALVRPAPIYPRAWIAEGRRGTVIVEFLIDEHGAVRFPRVMNSTDSFLGGAAVAAVREWRFEPPRHRGKPALTRAQQVFQFELPAAPTPTGP